MNTTVIRPYSGPGEKNSLVFTSSAPESELFSAQPDTDIYAQATLAVNRLINNCRQHDMRISNLLKLVIYYVDDGLINVHELQTFISRQLNCSVLPVVTLIPLSQQHRQQLKIIIGAVGMQSTGSISVLACHHGVFNQAIRCNEIIFVGGSAEQWSRSAKVRAAYYPNQDRWQPALRSNHLVRRNY